MQDHEELLLAIEEQDVEAALAVLRKSPSRAETRDANGVSALMLALYRGMDPVVERIRSLRALDLFEASALGDLDRVDALLMQDPAAAGGFSGDGFTALHLAVFFKRIDVADRLLRSGADVNAVARNATRVRPVHSAAATREAAVVCFVLERGADPDVQQEGGYTALHAAAMQCNVEMAEAIVTAGADLAIVDDKGRTAYDYARDAGCEPLLAQLHVPATPEERRSG